MQSKRRVYKNRQGVLRQMSGKLYIVGTPIGNLGDITYRAVETLSTVDLIACEDTRHTRVLLDRYSIKKPLVSYYKQKEREATERILGALQEGKSVALVTDAGTPCVSDPGAVLVKEAREAGLEIVSVPGPSAVATAISVSGILNPRFAFIGFLPDKPKERDALVLEFSAYNVPCVLYCAPHDLKKTISYLYSKLGNRRLTVVKELTKMFESVYKGTLGEIDIADERGEFVLIVEPDDTENDGKPDIAEKLKTAIACGINKSDAVKVVSRLYGLNKNDVYAEALKLKD